MKPTLHHGDSVDSMSELNSFDSSKGDDQENIQTQGDCSSPFYQPANGCTSTRLLSQEGVYQLTKDVRTFSEALTSLKSVFLDDRSTYSGSLRVMAHERLGELLQVLRVVVDKYPEMNSTDVLTVASELIKHVKGYNYEQDGSDVTPAIFRAINNLAMIFSNSVSDCLMGEDNSTPVLAASSPLFEPNAGQNRNEIEYDEMTQSLPPDIVDSSSSQEVDTEECLLKLEFGMEMAFDRAKILSKYLGELISYVKKKANLELEHSRNLLKLSQQTKQILSEQSFLPFQSLYCTNLDHEREYASNCQGVHQTLSMKYVESLQAKKAEHDKRRKQIRDSWSREKKRSDEAISSMKKAKQSYYVKMQEYQKAREAALKAEGEQQLGQGQQTPKMSGSTSSSGLAGAFYSSSAGKVDKKKKQEEDSNAKALNAEQIYRSCIAEANKRVKDLEQNKTLYLQQLRGLMLQCDQTSKNVTLSFLKLHYQLYAPLPVQFQAMTEDAKRYEPGHQFTEYVRSIPMHFPQRNTSFQFEPYPSDTTASFLGTGGFSDTESSSSRSLDDLSDLPRHHAPRRHSTEDSLSSDDILDEPPTRDGRTSGSATLTPGDFPLEPSPLPFQKITKKANWVAANVKGAFTGKKASKATLFGVDFLSVAQGSPDGIPFLVKKCVSEIDNRALSNKGIYRMNGVKNRVERICAQFDSFPEKLDLSLNSPHDVTGALKHFLRQLSEPLLLFRYYDTFLDVAKDCAQVVKAASNEALNSEKDELSFELVKPHLKRIRDAVEQLPFENRNTLQYIISHLSRVAEHSHENKMTASNLAIVFGPTLLRRSMTDGNESLESLIDLPHQSRVVELLILHKDFVFGVHPIQPDTDLGILPIDSGVSSSKSVETDEKSLSNELDSEDTPSFDEKHLQSSSTSLELRSILSSGVGLNEDESLSNVPDSLPSTPDADSELQPNRFFRKTAIRYDQAPSPSELDYMAPPPLPARRRKKSQKPGEETESVDTPEHSPIKEYFSSSSFQAKIEKLGNLARRISRDAARHSDDKTSVSSSRKSSAIQSPRSSKDSSSRKPSLTQQPTPRSSKDGGTVSRKSSSIYIESSASPPVFFLENSPKSTTEVDDDVSFC